MPSYTSVLRQGKSPAYWNGVIVTRAWKGDLPEAEYAAMLRDSTKRDYDEVNRDGIPVMRLSDSEVRRAQRLLDRECVDRYEVRNVACNAGRTNVLNYVGNVVDQGVKYFAVGTGTGNPSSNDVALFTEYFRKQPTIVTLTGNQVLIATTFAVGEANTTYTEAGLIGGTSAVVTVGGAGTLFTHANYVYSKNSSITLTTDYFVYLT